MYLLQWIWKQLYTSDAKGCRDLGTLYAAKIFLRATNVNNKPLSCFYACEELLDKYLKALILTAALQFFGMDKVTDNPTKNTKRDNQTDEGYIDDVLSTFVKAYAIQHEPDLVNIQPERKCPECTKVYKTKRGLVKHLEDKHPDSHHLADAQQPKANINDYCRTAMGMVLMAQNFADARKCGDGERIVRLYKFFILHFKAAGKTKYAYHSLRLQAQVQCLLTEKMAHLVTWNRFVNNKGGATSNVEVDRDNEHRNKGIKEEISAFHGKVSDISIKRVGEAAQTLEKILLQTDKAASTKRPSGKHAKADTTEDVLALTDVLHKENVFASDQERPLHVLPDFQKDPFSHLDLIQLHQWMTDTLSKISKQKIFKGNS